MEQHYKLHRVRELAENDEDFVVALVGAFLEEVPEDAELKDKAKIIASNELKKMNLYLTVCIAFISIYDIKYVYIININILICYIVF